MSKPVLWAIGIAASFITAVSLVPKTELLTILNGIFLGVVVAVAIVYAPLMFLAAKAKRFDRVSQLTTGIALIWASITMSRLYWVVWHMYGAPISWRSNWFLSLTAVVSIVGGCLFVIAPGYPSDDTIKEVELFGANRKLLILLGAAGGVITFMVSLYAGTLFS